MNLEKQPRPGCVPTLFWNFQFNVRRDSGLCGCVHSGGIHWGDIIGRRCDWGDRFLDHILLDACLQHSGCADFEVIVELIDKVDGCIIQPFGVRQKIR